MAVKQLNDGAKGKHIGGGNPCKRMPHYLANIYKPAQPSCAMQAMVVFAAHTPELSGSP